MRVYLFAAVAALLACFAVIVGPTLEAEVPALRPVTAMRVGDVYQDGHRACFSILLRQQRWATPLRYQFRLSTTFGEVPLSTYPTDDQWRPVGDQLTTYSPGQSWRRNVCFRREYDATPLQNLWVEGDLLMSPAVEPWKTAVPLPSVAIPAVSAPSPD